MDTTTDVFDDAGDELSALPAQTIDDSDDPTDLSYVPPHATPNHRNFKDEPRDPHLPGRADAVAKHPGTCPFSGEKNVCATVQYAHGTARNNGYKRPKMMLNLEYHWGFPTPYTLSLDTKDNMFPVNPTVHVGHDNDGLGLLPQLDDLETLVENIEVNPTLPVNDRQKYDVLLPYPPDAPYFVYNPLTYLFKENLGPLMTFRDPVPDANGDRPTTQHQCPYPNHQLTLRLHPVFAIVDLYIKWVKHKDQPHWTPEQVERMTLVKKIMSFWLKHSPSQAFLKLRPVGVVIIPGLDSGATDANDEFRTPTRRPGGKGKGKAVADQAQPTVAGPSNAHASTSSAVPVGADGEEPAIAQGSKTQAPSKPAGVGTAQASKRRRNGGDSEDEGEDEDKAQRRKRAKGNGKGKPKKASKAEQAGDEADSSKTKRSKKATR